MVWDEWYGKYVPCINVAFTILESDPKSRRGVVGDPDGTFKTYDRNKLSFEHVMQRVIRIPHKCDNFCFSKFVKLVSLKVPSGIIRVSLY